jgi:hypothetical protein
MIGSRRLLRSLEGVDRPRPVRIGAEMTVQVGGSGQIDAHSGERNR